MIEIADQLYDLLKGVPIDLGNLFLRLQATLLIVFLVFLLRFILLRILFIRVRRLHARRAWRLSSFYISLFLIFLLLMLLWLHFLTSIITVLSIISTGVIIVSKEVILNIVGWFYLLVRRPFEPGNRVAIGEHIGDVLDIRLLDFTMIELHDPSIGGQSSGRVLHIPNALVFTQPVANASKEFAFNWNEIRIPLTLKSDWKKAVSIIEEVAVTVLEQISVSDQRIRRAEEKYAIRYKQLTPSVYVDFQAGSIVIYLRHLAEPRSIRIITDRIWRELLEKFQKNRKIDLFPGFMIENK